MGDEPIPVSRRRRGRSVRSALLVLGTTSVLLAVGCEAALRLAYPANGERGDTTYTWGHAVHTNELGFREREVPRPTAPTTASWCSAIR